MTEIAENCIRLQKSFLNFLHSSHALRCVAAYFFAKGADANEISFRTISGNPRQFNYRDESAGLCVSAQKI